MILPYGELDHVLATINRDLAALLHQSPAELVLGAEATGGDTLVVCGILGGKDVGKSTLINALAGVRVSADEREVGRGTSEPIAYVHEDQQATLADRLASLQLPGALQVRLHQVDTLRDSVLVDLPDFDSEFIDHLAIVEQIAPLLDRVLWLLTPRKIGDRAWVQMFRRVIQDHDNVYCVLNKFDELLKEADALTTPAEATAFAAAQQQWMARSIEDAGWPRSRPTASWWRPATRPSQPSSRGSPSCGTTPTGRNTPPSAPAREPSLAGRPPSWIGCGRPCSVR